MRPGETLVGRRATLLMAATVAAGINPPAHGAGSPIRIALVMTDANPFLAPDAAQKLGFFDKVGVKAEITGYSGGSTAMEALASGAADVSIFVPADVSMAVKQGVKAKIVAVSLLNHRDWKLFVRKDSPIASMAQLANKKVGITASGSATDFLALWGAKRANVSIVRVPVGGAGLAPNLLSGNIDAVVTFPQITYALENSGSARAIMDFGDFPPGDPMRKVIQSCWVASDNIIASNPDGLRRMLVGVFSAIAHMKKNPDKARAFIEKEMKVPAETAKLEYADAVTDYSDDGAIRLDSLVPSLEFLSLAGMTDMPSGKDIYTDAFVPVKVGES